MTFDLQAQPASISFAICGLCRIVSVFFFNLIKWNEMKWNEMSSGLDFQVFLAAAQAALKCHDQIHSFILICISNTWKIPVLSSY